MSLADKLNNAKRSETGLPCGVAKLLSEVQGEDKEALDLVFQSRSISGTISNRQIYDILLSEKHDISYSSVALHRRQQCRCFVGRNSQTRQQLTEKA